MPQKTILIIDPLHPYELVHTAITSDSSTRAVSSCWDEIELYRKTWESLPPTVKDQICQQCPGLLEPYFYALESEAAEQINPN